MTRRRALAAAAGAAAAIAWAAGCAAPSPPAAVHDGPVVLVTLGGVRADAVGFLGAEPPGLTPHLDRLAAEAEWAGAAVAPSSSGLSSLASYATGLGVWAHGVGFGARPLALPAALGTLAEALAARGYRTAGYVPGWLARADGWRQGFGFLRDVAGVGRAAGHLGSLDGGRDFLWIHLAEAEAPWRRHAGLLDRLPALSPTERAALPARIEPPALEALRDPASEDEAGRRAAAALYRLSVAAADRQLGRLLAGLERSGRRDETLLVVVSTHGQELADPSGWALAREHLEVPLVVDLPRRLAGEGAAPPAFPAATRLWATIVAAVGGPVPPAAAPPLFAPGAPGGALSELYLGDGVNETSWVADGYQLLRRVRFAPEDLPVRAVRRARVGGETPAVADPAALLAEVERAFLATPAWAGRGDAETRLVAWRHGGAEPVDDPALRAALAAAMERRRLAFTACDLAPQAAARARAAERRAAGGR